LLYSLLIKFNNDGKQFIQLLVSVFASDCVISPTNVSRGWAVSAGIGMTINLPAAA